MNPQSQDEHIAIESLKQIVKLTSAQMVMKKETNLMVKEKERISNLGIESEAQKFLFKFQQLQSKMAMNTMKFETHMTRYLITSKVNFVFN
jgi:hypothetical protein